MVSGCPRLRHTASKLRCQFVTVSADQMLTGLYINDIHSVRLASTRLTEKKKDEKVQGSLDSFPPTPVQKAPEKNWDFTPLFGWKENNWVCTEVLHTNLCLTVSEWVCVYSCECVCVYKDIVKQGLTTSDSSLVERYMSVYCLCICVSVRKIVNYSTQKLFRQAQKEEERKRIKPLALVWGLCFGHFFFSSPTLCSCV